MESFWQRAHSDPARIALIEPDGAVIRAGELGGRANQLVHGLRARGLETGDVVATLLSNGAPLVSTLLGVMQAGWHYTAINTHLTAPEIADILVDSRAMAFIVDARCSESAIRAAELAGLAPSQCFAVGDVPGFVPFLSIGNGQPTERPEGRIAGQFMQYTSGTTGRPKAVQREIPPFDPDLMVAALAPNLERYDVTPGGDDVHLVTSPMYHMAPLSFAYFSLHFGHTVVLMDGFDAEEALRLIETHRVTTTHMVPTQFHRIARLPDAIKRAYDLGSLRNVMHAAAPCPIDLKHAMIAWWGPVIYEYYGATEGGGTMVTASEWLERPGTVGRPWAGADVKILGDGGEALPPGEVGTVYMKLLLDFAYKDDPEKTASNRKGEYFTVGDVGLLDEDGYLFLCDRKIDMIISGGVNIYPAEVEAVLLAHPRVVDAAVFGVPHAEWGESVQAVVEVAAGPADAGFEAELIAHCEARLARYKCPRAVEFTTALPRDPNGKLYKRILRDPYWRDHDRSI